MSKELEALENLKELGYLIDEVSGLTKYVYEYDDSFDSRLEYICEQIGKIKNKLQPALQKLEAIDNANPSEALNITKATEKYTGIDLSIIKQALQKTQEQEKILSIIKEKNVDMFVLRVASSVEHYNNAQDLEQLTQEEFDLLKRWTNVKI